MQFIALLTRRLNQDFIEESKTKKSRSTKPDATKARRTKTDYSNDSDDYSGVEEASSASDEEESRSQADSDSDADNLTHLMASMKLSKQKYIATKAAQTKKYQPKARKQVESDSEDDKENDKHRGNASHGHKSKNDERAVKKEVKKVDAIPEPKKPMNAHAIYVKARTPALKMKHPHSNGTTIKEIINSEWADLDLKLKEVRTSSALILVRS